MAALAERELFSSWVVLVYNRQILVQVGDAVDSPQRPHFFHIAHVCVSDGGQLAEDRLSTVDNTLLLSLVWEEAQQSQTAIEEVR